VQVAVIHCSPVMQTRLFEPNWVDRTVLHSFAYPRLLWESASWHIGVFVSRAQGDEAVVGIGLVHKGRQFASFERNLDVEDVHIPDQPVPVAQVQKQLGRGFADAIDADGPLSEARGKRLLDALESLAPELKQVVGKLKERIDAAIEQGASGELLGLQKDATGVLLMACRMDRHVLRHYAPQPTGTPFLTGVPGAHIAGADEDRRWFPDLTYKVAWREFSEGNAKIKIYNASPPNLEDEVGVDLIYHNVAHDSFVIVQYKRMRGPVGAEPFYRPGAEPTDEIGRICEIDAECLASDNPLNDEVRLVPTPCLVKVCKPRVVIQDSIDLIPGMYFTREHFEALLRPRGELTFGNVPRYMNNTTFADLMGAGWIGSRGRGTDYVKAKIAESLALGRAVVAGIDLGSQTPRSRRFIPYGQGSPEDLLDSPGS